MSIGRRANIVNDINSLESESGVIATLFHHPDFYFECEELQPNHFFNQENRLIYGAMSKLIKKGIDVIDPYNISEQLHNDVATRRMAEELITVENLDQLQDMSDTLARSSVSEYKVMVKNVLDAAFRRDTYDELKECERICLEGDVENVQEEIYNRIDSVLTEYSTIDRIPAYGDVIDDCWAEIESRQQEGYAGIPFKFKTLNEFATIEKGELFIFAAEAKQGKSMMLLNCAVDLLKNNYSVLYLDSELNTRLFTARILSHLTGIEYKRLTAGKYTEEERDNIEWHKEWLKSTEFVHVYIPMFDQQTIYTTVKKVNHMFENGIDVVIVDYFKSSGDGDAFSSYAELGKFVDLLKNRICGEMGICGLGAAQATATGKVADSAKIGRNASVIALIQDKSPEEIETDGEECGNKKLRIILNRNGPQHAPGEYIDLNFNGNLISYEEAKQHIPVVPY